MPSPDDTFYNIKKLHAVFALSSAALLAVTVWMLAVDHYREWKVYQRMFRDRIEPWLTEAEILRLSSERSAVREQQLRQSLEKARAAALDPARLERFREEVLRGTEIGLQPPPDFSALENDCRKMAAQPGEEKRRAVLDRLRGFAEAVRRNVDNVDRELRFRQADFDEARSAYEAAVGQGAAQEKLAALLDRVDRVKEEVARLTARRETAAAHHDELVAILGELTREENEARQALADYGEKLERMRRALDKQAANWGKNLSRLPLIDALGGSLSVSQVWLPELTIDYTFRRVDRFDRCTTCHLGIDKTWPGRPAVPAYLPEETLTVSLARPTAAKEAEAGRGPRSAGGERPEEPSLEDLYGLALAPRGILDRRAATIGLVLPKTAAAHALLLPGDAILAIDGRPVASREEARATLLEAAAAPASSGGASADEADEDDAARPPIELKIRRGLPQPYWSHPRLDLFVGPHSPHPLAKFGCTICHDGQGSATEFRFASHTPDSPGDRSRWQAQYAWFWQRHWDFPMRASRFTESSCLRCHHDVTDLEPSERFPDPPAPKLLEGYHLVRRNGCFGCHEIKGISGGQSVLPVSHKEVLEPGNRIGPDMRLEPLGTMRKVGPSLRDVASKLDAAFLESWIADPSGFRPETHMPHFFGLHDHLEGKTLEDARRLEAVEIRAIAEYLFSTSHAVPPLETPPGVTEPASAERGKELFFIKGCAACHKHSDFPEVESVQGPDLSNLGSKITTESGRKWLASWIRDPTRHSPRTLMPNPLLEPIPLNDARPDAAVRTSRLTDPADDIAAYLLDSNAWHPAERTTLVAQDLDELALMHLSKTYPTAVARQYLAQGIPKELAGEIEGDVRELLGPITLEKKFRYVGRRTIRKRGCFGCHDISGFEDAQPIGPALSDWGRKQESLLAFNQVHRYLADSGRHAPRAVRPATETVHSAAGVAAQPMAATKAAEGTRSVPATVDEFYIEAIRAQRREGFLWQKLREPRSFDYKVARNKPYNEQLLMGRFSLTETEREAIMTFILGLVADPPAAKYVYQPDPPRRAVVEGRKVLDQYGCAECHTLQMERWQFHYDPEKFEDPFEMPDFDFVKPHVAAEVLARSVQTDRRGLGHAEVIGMPRVDSEGELLEDEDDEGNPRYFFTLWEPAVINGRVWPVGGADVMVSLPKIDQKRPPWGGAFARLLYPTVLEQARAGGATASEVEAWGWVPPSLVHQGAVVEPSWLYRYLLNPSPIRPAVVLRMPKYNLSPGEARTLVDYFAAVSRAEYPYTSSRPGQILDASERDSQRFERLNKAMRLVTDRTTYCAKCHLIGDLSPGGDVQTTLAPNLERVGRRIRPEYLRRWLANPKSILPYTAMPVNFPPEGPPMGQELYEGSSAEQLDAVSDLLLNYDWYLQRRAIVRERME